MTSNRFFVQKEHIQLPHVFLSDEEHFHLSKVARVRIGDQVWLFDRTGISYKAVVEDIRRDSTRLLILETKKTEDQKVKVTLAQAVIKHKFMDLIVQKATEVGVRIFIPVITERTGAGARSEAGRKKQRWEKIALEALKQCGRNRLPEFRPPLQLHDLLGRAEDSRKFFLNEKGNKYLRDVLISSRPSEQALVPNSVLLLVGPEGGWTDEEEKDILEQDFEALKLDRYTLRSETAAIVSVAMINHFWNV